MANVLTVRAGYFNGYVMNDKNTLTYDEFVAPTAKSFLVTFAEQKVWLPQSLTEIDESDNTLEIPLWLAEEK